MRPPPAKICLLVGRHGQCDDQNISVKERKKFEARASQMKTADTRQMLLGVADQYDRLGFWRSASSALPLGFLRHGASSLVVRDLLDRDLLSVEPLSFNPQVLAESAYPQKRS